MPKDRTNADRAKDAREAISLRVYGYKTEGAHAITDLLADLMHLCAADGHDFDNQLRIARDHFEHETTKGADNG